MQGLTVTCRYEPRRNYGLYEVLVAADIQIGTRVVKEDVGRHGTPADFVPGLNRAEARIVGRRAQAPGPITKG